MGKPLTLTAADGHKLAAWKAEPKGAPKGGLIVLQEIFGLNAHIRAVTDSFATDGYLAIAPALFDRVERGIALGYDAAAVGHGRSLRAGIPWDAAMADVEAAHAAVGSAGKVAAIGYCWGGTVAWMAAAKLKLDATIAYYGAGIFDLRAETPRCPVLMHFGGRDASIPSAAIAAIRKAQPAVEVQVYPDSDHGFNCDARGSFDPAAAKLARERSLAFLVQHIG